MIATIYDSDRPSCSITTAGYVLFDGIGNTAIAEEHDRTGSGKLTRCCRVIGTNAILAPPEQ